jgi:restriction endonuclease Mrr
LLLAHQATLKDLVYENESEVKRRIISELQNLGATDFEQFCMSFLGPLGYEQLEVTGRGADRGIDGFGYSDKALSRFALLFRRSVGGKIRSAARRLTSSAARSKAIMTTGYF